MVGERNGSWESTREIIKTLGVMIGASPSVKAEMTPLGPALLSGRGVAKTEDESASKLVRIVYFIPKE